MTADAIDRVSVATSVGLPTFLRSNVRESKRGEKKSKKCYILKVKYYVSTLKLNVIIQKEKGIGLGPENGVKKFSAKKGGCSS